MATRGKSIQCSVVNETITAKLRNRRVGGFSGSEQLFAQCDQLDCQYADENVPPCPLVPSLFADEIARRERARSHDELDG